MAHTISDNIRAEMARKRVLQVQLGERIGLAQRPVSWRLLGKTPWTADELLLVAQALEVDVAALYAGVAPVNMPDTTKRSA